MDKNFDTHRQLHYWRRRLRHVDAAWAPVIRALLVWQLKYLPLGVRWSPILATTIDAALVSITYAIYGLQSEDKALEKEAAKDARRHLKAVLREMQVCAGSS